MMYGLQTRVGKEINHKIVKQLLKKDKSKNFSLKIKEFDNLKKLIANFVKKNFSYISYVYGGFKEIHEQSIKQDIPLLNHDETCYLCKKNRKKTQKVGFFSKLFKKNKTEDNINAYYQSSKNQHVENGHYISHNFNTVVSKENFENINEISLDKKDLNISSNYFFNLRKQLKL
jgi:hypothetical protein